MLDPDSKPFTWTPKDTRGGFRKPCKVRVQHPVFEGHTGGVPSLGWKGICVCILSLLTPRMAWTTSSLPGFPTSV